MYSIVDQCSYTFYFCSSSHCRFIYSANTHKWAKTVRMNRWCVWALLNIGHERCAHHEKNNRTRRLVEHLHSPNYSFVFSPNNFWVLFPTLSTCIFFFLFFFFSLIYLLSPSTWLLLYAKLKNYFQSSTLNFFAATIITRRAYIGYSVAHY